MPQQCPSGTTDTTRQAAFIGAHRFVRSRGLWRKSAWYGAERMGHFWREAVLRETGCPVEVAPADVGAPALDSAWRGVPVASSRGHRWPGFQQAQEIAERFVFAAVGGGAGQDQVPASDRRRGRGSAHSVEFGLILLPEESATQVCTSSTIHQIRAGAQELVGGVALLMKSVDTTVMG